MQSAIVNNTCPLCRREAASAAADFNSSRLCAQCRSMLEPILPKAKTTAGVSVLELQTPPAELAYQPQLALAETGGNGQPHFAEPITTPAPPIPQSFDFDSSIEDVNFIEEIEAVEELSYPDLEISFDPAEEEFNLATEPAQAPAPLQQPIYDSHEAQDDNSSCVEPNEPVIETEQVEAVHHAEPGDDEAFEAQAADDVGYQEQSEVIYQENQASDEAPTDGAQVAQQAEASDYGSATDPWDNPLPTSEYSQNEWPVMLSPDKPSTSKKLRVPIAIALVIASGVAAYFLFFRHTGETAPSQQSAATQKEFVIASTPAAEKASAASEQAAPQSLAPVETPSGNEQAQPSNETTAAESGGRFTLQLAAMPNEAAANEMADRLKASGLPAYVVSANLGSRGVWFRVRVGKFETAEDAKSFAAKSRLEARVERNDN